MKLQSNNVWFTSDTHYHHANIVAGVTNWRNADGNVPYDLVRDFDSIEEMNRVMVDNINNCVDKNDWLIHLGDWSFGGYDKITEFREQINCKNIVLILGNHDHHIQRDKAQGPLRKLFSHVAHYEELSISKSSGSDKNKIVLCHYPIISWNNMHNGSYMLHGHQHLKGEARFGLGKRMDVGLCGTETTIGFRPYHFEEVIDLLRDRERILPDNEHHIIK